MSRFVNQQAFPKLRQLVPFSSRQLLTYRIA
jgi:hypothetical protein